MKIIDIAVRRPVAIAMTTFAILLFGMVSLGRLSVNLLPDLSYPTLTIRTEYQGAAPAEVEQLISKPIEEAIGVVKGVNSVTSTSRAGQSDVVLEFDWGTEMDFASLEVREKLDILQLPLDIEKPRLLRFNPSLDPVMRYGLSMKDNGESNERSLIKLRTYAEEQIKRKLESVEGVASVRIGGALENEIQVLVDQRKASQLNVSIDTVVNRLKQENVNTSSGRIEDGTQSFLVRTLNKFESLEDISNLYVASKDGKNIRLGDIAIINNAYKDRDATSRFNGLEGAEISIYKEGDANVVEVANRIKLALPTLQKNLPENYTLEQVYDQSTFIEQAINDVKSSAIIGGLLAMFVLYLFLRDFWPTLIISISIPVSVIATFNLMYAYNISLNIMSLGGIALAVGLLVDSSIVVLENIDKHKQKLAGVINYRSRSATAGTKEVSGAIIASTLTTMAVFVPLLFVTGIAGQLFGDQAMTVSFSLVASLVVALTLIPAMSGRDKSSSITHADTFEKTKSVKYPKLEKLLQVVLFLPKVVFYYFPLLVVSTVITIWKLLSRGVHYLLSPLTFLFDKGFAFLASAYEKTLALALQTRILVLFIAVSLMVGAAALVPKLGMELIPKMSQGELYVEVNLPTGSRVEETDSFLKELSDFASGLNEIERTYSIAGTGSLLSASPSQGGDHWGKLNIVLKDSSSTTEESVKTQIRTYLSKKAGVQSKFGYPELFTFASPIQIELQGYDLKQLKKVSDNLVESLEQSSQFADINSTLRSGNPELKIDFNHAKLARLGLDAPTVSKLISTKVGGEIATKYDLNDRKIDILVRTQERQRDNIDDIKRIIINPNSSTPIPLEAVAHIYMSVGPSEITRVGQQRVAIVRANLAFGDLAEGVEQAQQIIDKMIIPNSVKARIAGQSEDMNKSFASLQLALVLAVFMVYVVMASQFESLMHPLLVLFAVPLAGAGSVYGLWLTGTNISIVVFIGLIMLCGIVVNNAIVLIDRINQLREKGENKQVAIMNAASSRLRPIIMTTLTTVLGLFPMALSMGSGAEVRAPMAITVIFGLFLSTLLTLILLPVMYDLFDNKRFDTDKQGNIVKEDAHD